MTAASRLTKLRRITVAALCFTAFTAAANVSEVQQALDSMQTQRLDAWRFSAIERTHSRVMRMTYHPVRNGVGRIELLNIDGQEPTLKELKAFTKSHPPRSSSDASNHGYELRQLITPDSLQLLSSHEDIQTFSFTPRFAFAGTVRSDYPMQGTLEFDTQQRFITSFDMRTHTSFKPKRGTRIDHFHLTIEFDRHSNGTVLTRRVRTRLEGKALLLFTVIQDIELYFFDYVPLLRDTPAQPDESQ